ncbi:MAG: HNH endonuclease [Akkermansiaceae bacterium]|nr:HNH endonuclease [Akkermansiaceae bacterium]
MTLEELRNYVARHPGENLPTVASLTTFKVSEKGNAFVFALTSGKARNESFEWIRTSLEIFNRTGSLSVRDYGHSQNTSYVLGLIKAVGKVTRESELLDDLDAINRESGHTPTTKQALVDARIGQGQFRTILLSTWESGCAVTGATTLHAIRASHIKPWRLSSHSERLDSANGLPLIANLDALFDSGLITFSDDGALMTSPCMPENEKAIFGLHGLRLRKPPLERTAAYLDFHRSHLFLDHESTLPQEGAA